MTNPTQVMVFTSKNASYQIQKHAAKFDAIISLKAIYDAFFPFFPVKRQPSAKMISWKIYEYALKCALKDPNIKYVGLAHPGAKARQIADYRARGYIVP